MDHQAWDDRYAAREWLWTVDANRFVVAETEDLPPGRVLDLAAGEGRNAVWLATRGWNAVAVDFSQVAIDRARELAARERVRIEAIRADLLEFEPEPQSFDLVIVAYLHVPEDQLSLVLSTAVEAVAPGGRVLVIGHDRANLEHGYGGPQVREVLYTREGISAGLAPLEIIKAERVERHVDTEDGPRTALDTLVVARR
jgi:SAM-dependent methyltransferase